MLWVDPQISFTSRKHGAAPRNPCQAEATYSELQDAAAAEVVRDQNKNFIRPQRVGARAEVHAHVMDDGRLGVERDNAHRSVVPQIRHGRWPISRRQQLGDSLRAVGHLFSILQVPRRRTLAPPKPVARRSITRFERTHGPLRRLSGL